MYAKIFQHEYLDYNTCMGTINIMVLTIPQIFPAAKTLHVNFLMNNLLETRLLGGGGFFPSGKIYVSHPACPV